ncbi:MAG: ABC transporter permease [Clostridia bacterium]|nr:ABC transporter permease [Clostridia bacterium]MBQ4108633.1 ABC transporter permease [Clostridia bacterium]
MFKYILKRVGLSILILVAVSLIIYFLVRLMPLDFVASNAGMNSEPETLDKIREQLGLQDNSFFGIIKGYFKWIGNLFEFENGYITLGRLFGNEKPVSQVIVQGLPTSFVVAFVATIFEFLIAIPLGITAATHQYSVRDYVITVLVMVGISLPSFFFGNVFKAVFAELLGWFPTSGATDASQSTTGIIGILSNFKYYVLPIFTITILSLGGRMRMTRTNMLEVLNSDYIRTARAKGLKESKVIYKHAFRNTLIPLVTTLAGLIPSLFSGAIITEKIFGLDGIGTTALTLTNTGNIPFIMGYNMFLAVLSILGILLSDIMYAIVDPRVKLE